MTAIDIRPKMLLINGGVMLALILSGCEVETDQTFGSASEDAVEDPPTIELPDPTPSMSPYVEIPPATSFPSTEQQTFDPPPEAAPSPTAAPASWPEIIAQVESGVVQFSVTRCDSSATGSGFLVGPNLVVTAAHVVADASAVRISLPEGTAAGSVLGINELADLALVETSTPLRKVSRLVRQLGSGGLYEGFL